MTDTGIIAVILLVWFWVWYDHTVRKPKKDREAEASRREAEALRIERDEKERLRLEEEAEERAEARIRPARNFLWESWVHLGRHPACPGFGMMGTDKQLKYLRTQFGLSQTEAEEVFNQVQNDIP